MIFYSSNLNSIAVHWNGLGEMVVLLLLHRWSSHIYRFKEQDIEERSELSRIF